LKKTCPLSSRRIKYFWICHNSIIPVSKT
jgi:hypothetical protein